MLGERPTHGCAGHILGVWQARKGRRIVERYARPTDAPSQIVMRAKSPGEAVPATVERSSVDPAGCKAGAFELYVFPCVSANLNYVCHCAGDLRTAIDTGLFFSFCKELRHAALRIPLRRLRRGI